MFHISTTKKKMPIFNELQKPYYILNVVVATNAFMYRGMFKSHTFSSTTRSASQNLKRRQRNQSDLDLHSCLLMFAKEDIRMFILKYWQI